MPHPRRHYLALTIAIALCSPGCASKRQIAIDHPLTKTSILSPVKGYERIDGDDY